jgi:hypothetical protein
MIKLTINTKEPILIVSADLPPVKAEDLQRAADELPADVIRDIDRRIMNALVLPSVPILFPPSAPIVYEAVALNPSVVMWTTVFDQPCIAPLRITICDELVTWGPDARRRWKKPRPRRPLSRKQRIRRRRLARRWLQWHYSERALFGNRVTTSAT